MDFVGRVSVSATRRFVPSPLWGEGRVRGSDRTVLHLAPGGIDSLRSPCGQPVRCALRLSNGLLPVVEPSVGGSHPSLSGEYKRKEPVLSYELSSRIWR